MNSVPSPEQASAPNVRDVQMRAAEWVHLRRDCDTWSDADQAALDAWLAQSPSNQVAYWRLDAAWERTQKLSALSPLPREDAPARRYIPVLLKIAATIVIAAAAVGTVYVQRVHTEHKFTTAIGSRENLTLADGTHIELNTNTSLRVSADQQTVWLDRGEAYFEVKHNTARNFAVIADGHRIVDLGTKFAIRTNANRLQVAMVEGRVRLDVPRDRKDASLLLTTGDVAVASGDDLTVTREAADELARDLAWRRGMLVFNNTTLADAVAEFNRYNREKLTIAEQSVAELKIDGTFPANDTALFTRATQQLFHLHVVRQGRETVLSR